ncbi:fido domain-containing protein [Chytriomyces cf. hyalinus JEL632]|nr:fido domain-containing protein [Chytriomyces cf. hyalinus JEL632]
MLAKMLPTQTGFDVLQIGWWVPTYVTQRSVEVLVAATDELSQKIKTIIGSKDPSILAGFDRCFRSIYLLECLVGEAILDGDTSLDTIDSLLLPTSTRCKLAQKVRNLETAFRFLFPSTFLPPTDHVFAPGLALELHRIVGRDIIHNAGSFRENWARPCQEQYTYLPPHLIKSHLEGLCQETSEALAKSDTIMSHVRIVASFLTSFLHIHPFSNGSGRVARLLTSFLLAKFSFLPVFIAGSNSRREILLQCLRKSRLTSPFKPDGLARLLLQNME